MACKVLALDEVTVDLDVLGKAHRVCKCVIWQFVFCAIRMKGRLQPGDMQGVQTSWAFCGKSVRRPEQPSSMPREQFSLLHAALTHMGSFRFVVFGLCFQAHIRWAGVLADAPHVHCQWRAAGMCPSTDASNKCQLQLLLLLNAESSLLLAGICAGGKVSRAEGRPTAGAGRAVAACGEGGAKAAAS